MPLARKQGDSSMTCFHHKHDTPSYPKNSDLNTEWRKALRSNRSAWWRRRIRELRASTRASEPSISRVGLLPRPSRGQNIELKLREGWLGLQKISLKIRRIFK
jgi:hypothetical protein